MTKTVFLPPSCLLMAAVLMLILFFALPGPTVIPAPWTLLGLLPLGFGLWINLMADRIFHQVNTTVNPFEEPTTLIYCGVYTFSRNPMYLGFVAILAGMAVLLGAIIPMTVVPVFAILIDRVYIRMEEQKMARLFGEIWQGYVKIVRRWI